MKVFSTYFKSRTPSVEAIEKEVILKQGPNRYVDLCNMYGEYWYSFKPRTVTKQIYQKMLNDSEFLCSLRYFNPQLLRPMSFVEFTNRYKDLPMSEIEKSLEIPQDMELKYYKSILVSTKRKHFLLMIQQFFTLSSKPIFIN